MFNHVEWHLSKVKHRIWDELIIYAKTAWKRVVEQIRISRFLATAFLQGFDKSWGLGVSFVEGITCILNGTEKGNAVRWVGVPFGWSGGCPWLGWGEDLGLVGMVGSPWWVLVWLLLRGGVFVSEGLRLPSLKARFSFGFIHFGVGPIGLLSKKNIIVMTFYSFL